MAIQKLETLRVTNQYFVNTNNWVFKSKKIYTKTLVGLVLWSKLIAIFETAKIGTQKIAAKCLT